MSTVSADQLAVDEKLIRISGGDYWLYGAVDLETKEIVQLRLFQTATKKTTRWFLAGLHRRYQLDGVEFLVNDADYMVNVLDGKWLPILDDFTWESECYQTCLWKIEQ